MCSECHAATAALELRPVAFAFPTTPDCGVLLLLLPLLLLTDAADACSSRISHRVTLRSRVLGLVDSARLPGPPSRSAGDREALPALCLLLHHLAISGEVPPEIILQPASQRKGLLIVPHPEASGSTQCAGADC